VITPQAVARIVAIYREWPSISAEVDAKILADYSSGRPVGTYTSSDEYVVDAVKARYEMIGWSITKEWTGSGRVGVPSDQWTLTFNVPEKLVAEAERETK